MTTQTTPAAPPAGPAPKNGAPAGQPQQPSTPAPPPPDATAAELKTWQERAAKAEQLAAQKTREEVVNRRKWEGEKKSFGEKLKLADEYAKLQREKDINPIAAAKRLWGDKWHEHLNTVAANGGAPTAESVAFEIEQREQALRKEFDEREQKRIRDAQTAQQQRVESQLRAFNSQAVTFAKEATKEYPIFEQFKSDERVAGALVHRIRETHDATIQRDPESGQVLVPGKVMSFKEAADALEADLYAIADAAAGNPKYAEKLRAKLTPAKTPGTVPVVKSSQSSSQGSTSSQSSSQPRRTVGNDMTGSTPPAPSKYRTEQQRQADALAAYERAKKPAYEQA